MDSKFQLLSLLSKLYASNTSNAERKETERTLAQYGNKYFTFINSSN